MVQITVGKKTFVVPGPDSPCDLWKTYYQQLRDAVGKKHAQTIWLITWGENGATGCTTNAGFNQWLKKEGLEVSNAATRTIADLSAIQGSFLGMGKNLAKFLSIGIPLLLGSVTMVIIVLLINTARKGDMTDLAALHPAGRTAKLSSLNRLAR